MESNIKKIAVLTSGGDAPGMNAAVRAVVRGALKQGFKVLGVKRGYQGLLEDDIVEMDAASVSDIIQKGGTVLKTARSSRFATKEGVETGARILREHEVDALVVIGGDGSFRGALDLSREGINLFCIPGTIDLDVACTDYTIGFDTACNTAMDAIDKIRDTSSSHGRCSIIEVMGRSAGYIATHCGIATGAEDVLIPELYNGDIEETIQKLCDHIEANKGAGKTHFLVVNAEGIGHSEYMAEKIQEKTGVKTVVTILGYIQRGGSPSCRDRFMATMMGVHAVDLMAMGYSNRVVAFKDGEIVDYDIQKALRMRKDMPQDITRVTRLLVRF